MSKIKPVVCLLCGSKALVYRGVTFDENAYKVECSKKTGQCLKDPITGLTSDEAILKWNQFQSFIKIRILENEIQGLKMALEHFRADEANPRNRIVNQLAYLQRGILNEARNRNKGDDWQEMTWEWLLMRLGEETGELIKAIEGNESPKRIVSEAADVANFCAMIADKAIGLPDAERE